MGNIIQTLSGKNNNSGDDNNVVIKNQQVQLLRANPVLSMFLKYVENLGHQVEKFKAKLDFSIVTKYFKKVEQQAQLFNEKYVFPIFYEFLDSLRMVHQQEEEPKSNIVLYQVYAIGGYFFFKWVWGRWALPREEDDDSDDD
ncbi:uncharacterized protein LOC141719647 [Apium graveolens]|uniref:uncharacterized protein LOC141719647 n=1 Tax=Apium graveolens TaxID=4045 RepID=UPI003D79CEAA